MVPLQTILNDLTREQQVLDKLELQSEDAKKLQHVLSDGLIPLLQTFIETTDDGFADIGEALDEIEGDDEGFDEQFVLAARGLAQGALYLADYALKNETEDESEAKQMAEAVKQAAALVYRRCEELSPEEDQDGSDRENDEANDEA